MPLHLAHGLICRTNKCSWCMEGVQYRLVEGRKKESEGRREGRSVGLPELAECLACPACTGTKPLLRLLTSSLKVGAHCSDRSVSEKPPATPSRMHPLICFFMLLAMRKDDLFSDFDACCILMKIKIPYPFSHQR